jgi:hypothetical protein
VRSGGGGGGQVLWPPSAAETKMQQSGQPPVNILNKHRMILRPNIIENIDKNDEKFNKCDIFF